MTAAIGQDSVLPMAVVTSGIAITTAASGLTGEIATAMTPGTADAAATATMIIAMADARGREASDRT
ncbi:MAG: hypothetical protein COA68_12475, partial [Oceanobacter sp.]